MADAHLNVISTEVEKINVIIEAIKQICNDGHAEMTVRI
jgi:hypothetical protein